MAGLGDRLPGKYSPGCKYSNTFDVEQPEVERLATWDMDCKENLNF